MSTATTTEPIQTVRSFFEAWGTGDLIGSIERYCAPECYWSNTGMPTAEGIDAMKGVMQAFIDGFGLARADVELVSIAAEGDKVLTERVDRCIDGDGNTIADVYVSGMLQVRDGKIVAFRDYWDPRPFLPEG